MLASAERRHIRKSEKKEKRKSVLQKTEAGQCGGITVDSFVVGGHGNRPLVTGSNELNQLK